MANKLQSLSLKSDFQKLYKRGFVLKKKDVTLRFVSNKNKGLRVTFSVSKKVVRGAVCRNKIKRWAREIFRENPNLKNISGDFLVTFLSDGKSYESIKKQIHEAVLEAKRSFFSKDSSFSNRCL